MWPIPISRLLPIKSIISKESNYSDTADTSTTIAGLTADVCKHHKENITTPMSQILITSQKLPIFSTPFKKK